LCWCCKFNIFLKINIFPWLKSAKNKNKVYNYAIGPGYQEKGEKWIVCIF